jgi:hypothetical protein
VLQATKVKSTVNPEKKEATEIASTKRPVRSPQKKPGAAKGKGKRSAATESEDEAKEVVSDRGRKPAKRARPTEENEGMSVPLWSSRMVGGDERNAPDSDVEQGDSVGPSGSKSKDNNTVKV